MRKLNTVTVLVFTVAALQAVHLQAVGTDCNGKTFLCLDDLRYQVCSQSSGDQTETTDLTVFDCDPSQYCSNDDQSACSSTATTTTQTTTTTSSTTTTQDSSTTSTTTSTQSTTIDPTSTVTTADPSSTTSTTTESTFNCRETGRFPHSSDCHKYYLCVVFPFGNYETAETCLFGWVFDPVSQRCTADQSKCKVQPQTFTCTSVGRFPDPSDSTRYFWCRWDISSSRYELMKMTCPFGFPFNANRGKCSGFFGWIGL